MAAAAKNYFSRPKYRFLPTDHQALSTDSMMFELDESDLFSTSADRSQSPELMKTSSRRKSTAIRGGGPASLPVNVPDWSKILKGEYRENRRSSDGDFDEDEVEEDEGGRIPPHEFLARQMARSRIVSFSVHEGIGRTLKGRDLSRVRNAIWQKTGFED